MTFPYDLTRRTLLMAACSMIGHRATAAPAGMQADMTVAGRRLAVTRFATSGAGKRPAVLLLHGSRGLDARRGAYERHAGDLAAAGIDAYLFSYYGQGERERIGRSGSAAAREACYERFAEGWVARVRAVATQIGEQDISSGKIGLLGFSLGGYVAVAASQPPCSALAVFYAGLPAFYHHPITSLPPLLALHGDADRNVPLANGQALVARAKALGGPAELVVYPGEAHGFDLDLANPHSAPAMAAAVSFFRRTLAS